jgi:hypothetical protein
METEGPGEVLPLARMDGVVRVEDGSDAVSDCAVAGGLEVWLRSVVVRGGVCGAGTLHSTPLDYCESREPSRKESVEKREWKDGRIRNMEPMSATRLARSNSQRCLPRGA